MKIKNILFAVALGGMTLAMAGCGSKKAATEGTSSTVDKHNGGNVQALAFVQKVANQKVSTQNIVGKMSLNVQMGSKNITVPGSLHMRYGEVIRIQAFIPLLGSEVGRIEFTPDYVLVIDRMHKEYIKEDYNKVDFLKNNGLNFYSLQALFWNQLFMPGTTSISDANLLDFGVTEAGNSKNITLKKGNLNIVWNADNANGRISTAKATYSSLTQGKSSLNWTYSNFKAVAGKMFPAYQKFTFATTAIKNQSNISLTIDMDGVKTDSKWEAKSEISKRYKKIEATDVFGKLFGAQ
ncbi:MAG: DUF4292 domain-containing protein [Prevotella sp.]|nr:DUF4292 domain-containing protein [Prevotella sp.]